MEKKQRSGGEHTAGRFNLLEAIVRGQREGILQRYPDLGKSLGLLSEAPRAWGSDTTEPDGELSDDLFPDVLLASLEIKKLIIDRCREYGIPLKWLVWDTGLRWTSFKKDYLEVAVCDGKRVTSRHIMQIANNLGIDITYNVTVKQNFDYDERRKQFKTRYSERSVDSEEEAAS